MGRSLKKGPYVDDKLFDKVIKQTEANTRDPIKTWARRCTIIPEFVGFTFMVHNGKEAAGSAGSLQHRIAFLNRHRKRLLHETVDATA